MRVCLRRSFFSLPLTFFFFSLPFSRSLPSCFVHHVVFPNLGAFIRIVRLSLIWVNTSYKYFTITHVFLIKHQLSGHCHILLYHAKLPALWYFVWRLQLPSRVSSGHAKFNQNTEMATGAVAKSYLLKGCYTWQGVAHKCEKETSKLLSRVVNRALNAKHATVST